MVCRKAGVLRGLFGARLEQSGMEAPDRLSLLVQQTYRPKRKSLFFLWITFAISVTGLGLGRQLGDAVITVLEVILPISNITGDADDYSLYSSKNHY